MATFGTFLHLVLEKKMSTEYSSAYTQNAPLASTSASEKIANMADLTASSVVRAAQNARVSIPMNMKYAKQTVMHNWVPVVVIAMLIGSVTGAVMYGMTIQSSSPCSNAGMTSLAFIVLVFVSLLLVLVWSLHYGHKIAFQVRNNVNEFQQARPILSDGHRRRQRAWMKAQFDPNAQYNLVRRVREGFAQKKDVSPPAPQQFEMQSMSG